MENRIRSRARGRSLGVTVRFLAFLAIVVGLVALRIVASGTAEGESVSPILVGALLGGAVAALFGLADWLALHGPH